jgi:hypothetical protein
MSRSDRFMILGAIVAVALVLGSVASAVVLMRPEPERDVWDFHMPETEVERTVATVGLAYLRALRGDRPDAACPYTAGAAQRALGCSTSPAVPEGLAIRPTARLHVFHVEVRDGTATLYAATQSGPNENLTLRDVGAWRIVKHRRFGFA